MANEKRLIDANAEIRKMRDALAKNKRNMRHLVYWVFDTVISILEKAPTVDAVEVVHGQWEEECGLPKCPVCGYEYTDYLECKNYCGNCGAKMDGGDGDG